MSATTNKGALRAQRKAVRDRLSAHERAAAEAAILSALFATDVWQNAPLVAGYTPIRGEMDLTPVWQAAVNQGKGYALPCTVTDATEGRMIFRRLSGYAPESLAPARFGIPEPDENHPLVSAADWENALIIVPGLSFDDNGFRIGYGGGYYDRFLAELTARGIKHTTVGLVFSACRTPELPHDPHDIPVDLIIDERRVIHTHGTDGTH